MCHLNHDRIMLVTQILAERLHRKHNKNLKVLLKHDRIMLVTQILAERQQKA